MSAPHALELPATSEPRDMRATPESPVSERPTVGAMFRDISPLIGAVPVAGPPAVLIAVPWLLFVLVLVGPFALLFTLVIVLLVAALLVVAVAAIPYLLVRHLRAARARHATSRAHVQSLPAKAPAVADRALLPGSVSAAGC
jgi:hypothetical protein